MKKISSSILVLLITLTATFLYQSTLARTTLFVNYRLKSIDMLFVWRAKNTEPLPHTENIAIVGIDDDSYRHLNKAWPWDRSVYAAFLENLQKLNPEVVGLDYSFAGRSQKEALDQQLAESIKENKNVVLSCYFDQDGRLAAPLDIFSESALGYGSIDKPYDKDSVNRREKNIVSLASNGNDVFSLSAWLAYAYWGLKPSNHLQNKDGYAEWMLKNAESGELEKFRVRTNAEGDQWISYRYKQAAFNYIPFWKIMKNEVSKREIQGKIVIVGPVSPLFHDVHPTPLGLMSGAVIIGNMTASILDHDFVEEAPRETKWILCLILTLFFTFIFYKLSFIKSLVTFVISEAAVYIAILGLFLWKNLLLEPFSPMVIVGVCYFITIFYKSFSVFLENMALQQMVITDGLTGLYGHRYLSLRLDVEFNRFRETRSNFCFVMMDVDHFKQVNDTHGHEAGNTVLVTIGKVLKSGVRGYDLAARYGGEEFSLVLFRIEEDIAYQIVQRIRTTVAAQSFQSPKGDFRVTISAGICSSGNADVNSKNDLIRLADQALYQAKSKGRDQTFIYKAKSVPASS